MSAPTGITISQELSSAFADAVSSNDTRFLKVSIQNESLVPDGVTPVAGTFEEDLDKLRTILDDATPAYVLARLDEPPSEWLAIYYVPDVAKVRDKMLYAATRNTLTKSLGSAHFTDNIFATNKDDLSADAYRKHRQHLTAPQPMSARELEMAAVKAAEREVGGGSYEGSRGRRNHVGMPVGHGTMKWTDEVVDALKQLGTGNGSQLLLLSIDPATEVTNLTSLSDCTVDQLGSSVPHSDPAYAFFAWSQNITSTPRRVIVFIYSCPSSSPVKDRMVYSLGCVMLYKSAKEILAAEGGSELVDRKIETSNPTELTESFLVSELGFTNATSTGPSGTADDGEKKPFARPRGPARRR